MRPTEKPLVAGCWSLLYRCDRDDCVGAPERGWKCGYRGRFVGAWRLASPKRNRRSGKTHKTAPTLLGCFFHTHVFHVSGRYERFTSQPQTPSGS